jgi:hypothetical protein
MIQMHLPDHCTNSIDVYNVWGLQPAIFDHPVTGVGCIEAVCFTLLYMHKYVGVCNARHLWLIFSTLAVWIINVQWSIWPY